MAWEEVIGLRNRTSKTFVDDANPLKRLLETQVGRSKHYLDAQGAWQDADETAEESDADGFALKFTKLSYFGRIDGEGRRRFYPDRNDLSYWIEFKKPFASMGTPTRHNRWFYWDFTNAIIGVRFDVDSLKFGFRLKNDQAPTSITIPFESQGITRQGRFLLHDDEVVAVLRKPIASGSNVDADGIPVQKECDVAFAPGEVTISLDPTGLEYPIEIDPTVDKEVAASGDDGRLYHGSSNWSLTTPTAHLGYRAAPELEASGFLRFTGVTIAGTIDVSYIECFATLAGTNAPELKVYGVDEDNPAAPTTEAEYLADPVTTAAVDWDGAWTNVVYNQSPSLNTIFQELVDTYAISNEAVMLKIRDDKGTDDHRNYCMQVDDANNNPAKLHIEYSAGAGIPIIMRHRKMIGVS